MNRDQVKPPFLAALLLKIFTLGDNDFSILVEFNEEFKDKVISQGVLRARFWYWRQLFKSVPFFIGNIFSLRWFMLKNYVIIAFRNIIKHKGFSLINISGLTLGMACCLLIMLWVYDELNYDGFHKNADELFRLEVEIEYAGQLYHVPVTSIPMGPSLKEELPEIINMSRYSPENILVRKGDKRFIEFGSYADPSFLELFTFPVIKGSEENLLLNLNSILISESMAAKYFGTEDPVGKILELDNDRIFTVEAVLKDFPQNSIGRFSFLIPYENLVRKDRAPEHWGRFQTYTVFHLQKNAVIRVAEQKIVEIFRTHVSNQSENLYLQPLTGIHLYSETGGGNIKYVYIFSLIAVFILLIACINFMNLTTARSSNRLTEIGMRKISGAGRVDIIKQFIGETLVFSCLAFILSLLLVYLLLPVYGALSGKHFDLNVLKNAEIVLGIVSIVVLTGIVAGSYPALFLSSFKPLNTLKGYKIPVKFGVKNSYFRRFLVVVQFSISIFLILSTAVVFKQLRYVNTANLGYERENILFISINDNIRESYGLMKGELLRDPNILNVTAVSALPTDISRNYNGFEWEGMNKETDSDFGMNLLSIDADFFETFNINIDMGREFLEELNTDKTNYILNLSAIRSAGIDLPVGKRFSWQDRTGPRTGEIIGVAEDFHYHSLHHGIGPLVIIPEPDRYNYFCIKTGNEPALLPGTVEYIKSIWTRFSPEVPFDYKFLNDEYDLLYRAEQRIYKIFSGFTFIALLISSMGLFGLSAFVVEQRTKELGIRKILGATVPGIIRLISKEFVLLVSWSNIISCPLAYIFMNRWLEDFAYHTSIGISIFVFTAAAAFFIAVSAISVQLYRAAKANPVDSLRYE